jgi:hypothetical protein
VLWEWAFEHSCIVRRERQLPPPLDAMFAAVPQCVQRVLLTNTCSPRAYCPSLAATR